MAHAQKPDFVFRRNGWVHLNRRGRQFSRLLAAEVCGSAIVMLDTPCSEVVWRVLATHSIRQFPLHFPSRASPCAIRFQLDSTKIQASCGSTAYRVIGINRSLCCSYALSYAWYSICDGGTDIYRRHILVFWVMRPCIVVREWVPNYTCS